MVVNFISLFYFFGLATENRNSFKYISEYLRKRVIQLNCCSPYNKLEEILHIFNYSELNPAPDFYTPFSFPTFFTLNWRATSLFLSYEAPKMVKRFNHKPHKRLFTKLMRILHFFLPFP